MEKIRKDVKHVLFVCTGNICRSPMAAGMLRSKLEQSGIKNIEVESAGTTGLKGEGPSRSAARVCLKKGFDISGHVGRVLKQEIIQESDLIVVMEIHHMERVLALDPEAVPKTFMLTEFGKGSHGADFIADPYGLPDWAFEACFEQIEIHVNALMDTFFRKNDEKD